MTYPRERSNEPEKNAYPAAVGWNVLQMSVNSTGSKVSSSSMFFYLSSVWVVYSLLKVGYEVLCYYYIAVSSFRSVNICFVYLGALMLGVCIFTIFISFYELTPLSLYKDLLCLLLQCLT